MPVDTYRPAPERVLGFTRLGEWLMVDLRLAKLIPTDSKLYEICHVLGERGAIGLIETTLIIDLLACSDEEGAFVLDRSNWPKYQETDAGI